MMTPGLTAGQSVAPSPLSSGLVSSPFPRDVFDDVLPYRKKIVNDGFRALMKIKSFTLLSNQLDSTVRISVLSNMMKWLGLSLYMCLETSGVVELNLLCSLNLAFQW